MSCANTNLPECMMETHGVNPTVSQKTHVEIGDTHKQAVSYFQSTRYLTVCAELPDTTEFLAVLKNASSADKPAICGFFAVQSVRSAWLANASAQLFGVSYSLTRSSLRWLP